MVRCKVGLKLGFSPYLGIRNGSRCMESGLKKPDIMLPILPSMRSLIFLLKAKPRVMIKATKTAMSITYSVVACPLFLLTWPVSYYIWRSHCLDSYSHQKV